MNAPAPVVHEEEIDLVLFELGPSVYGADAALVLRIDRPDEETVTLEGLEAPAHGKRALVFRVGDGERSIRVDAVRGVQPVLVSALRRLPPAAVRRSYAAGIWLDGENPVLLIDLLETLSP